MGFIKSGKLNIVRTEAERAVSEGRRVFVCRFDPGFTSKTGMSGSIGQVAEMIESVEDCGWQLDRFQTTSDHAMVGLFRRPGDSRGGNL